MPWQLCILKYDGTVPRFPREMDRTRLVPLGTREEVRQHVEAVFPDAAWSEETIASWPKLMARFDMDGLSFEMYLPLTHSINDFGVDILGRGNPVPHLRALLKPKEWIAMEFAREGEFFTFQSGANERWGRWQEYLAREYGSIEQLHSQRTTRVL